MFFVLGFSTLVLARTAALMETDGKKVVALSTLRQLGFIVIALALRATWVCLFHLLIHALAKANIFIIVGNLIHSQFSQQDLRFMSTGFHSKTVTLLSFISVLRLRGLVFTSGFFSKDLILAHSYRVTTSSLRRIILCLVISFTLAYCLKLIIFLTVKTRNAPLQITNENVFRLLPRLVLRIGRLRIGQF